jgi:hypothetical protein
MEGDQPLEMKQKNRKKRQKDQKERKSASKWRSAH